MPADFRRYVDLTPYDADPTDIYLGALRLARLTLPEFQLRQGTVEDALFQAAAYMQMLSVAAINRIPSRLMEGVARIMGVERTEGERAVVDITVTLNEIPPEGQPFVFSKSSAFTYAITYASGTVSYPFMTITQAIFNATIVRVASTANVALANELENGDTLDGVTLATGDAVLLKDQTAAAENGIYTVVASGAAVRATTANQASELPLFISVIEGVVGIGTGWNMTNTDTITLGTTAINYVAGTYPSKTITLSSQGVGIHPTPTAGQIVTLAAVAPQVQTAVIANPTNFNTGVNPETDPEYLSRAVTHIQGLSASLLTIPQLRSYVLLNHSLVARCQIYNTMTSAARNLDPAVLGGSGPTVNAGYVLAVVYGHNRLLTSTERTDIAIAISDKTTAGMTVAVEDPYLIEMEITAEVLVERRRTASEMSSTITRALQYVLSPTLWRGGQEAILTANITDTIGKVDGVLYVSKCSIAPKSNTNAEHDGSGTTEGNALLAASDTNVYFLRAGSLPSLAEADVTLTVTVAA